MPFEGVRKPSQQRGLYELGEEKVEFPCVGCGTLNNFVIPFVYELDMETQERKVLSTGDARWNVPCACGTKTSFHVTFTPKGPEYATPND